jgi:multiple sugar transport system permease protein
MLTRKDHMIFLLPLIIVMGPFLLWPVAFGFFASFTSYSPFAPVPRLTGLANYVALIGDPYFRTAFRTVGIFSVSAVAFELAIGMVVAWLLREPFPGRGAIRVVLLLPWLVGPVANGVMWHFLFEASTGIPNYLFALLNLPIQPSPLGLRGLALPATLIAEIWRTAPLASFLLVPGFSLIPRQLWEHSALEGTPLLSQVRHVVLPFLGPLLLTVAMLLAGAALGTFDSVLILTHGGPGADTLMPALYSYQKAFQVNNWPLGATSAWFIAAAVIMVGGLYIALSRRWQDG